MPLVPLVPDFPRKGVAPLDGCGQHVPSTWFCPGRAPAHASRGHNNDAVVALLMAVVRMEVKPAEVKFHGVI